MRSVSLTGLLKIELPDVTVRLCDGGIVRWGSETFSAKDALFGSIASLSELNEGVGEEVPAFDITFLPPESSTPDEIAAPGYQTARVSVWIAEYSPAAGSVVGTPDLVFLGQLDQIELGVEKDRRDLGCSVVSLAERLFNRNEGNTLSPSFHKSIWPGETGHDAANGLTIPVAWGVETTSGTTSGLSGLFNSFGTVAAGGGEYAQVN
jgi:hypothetical protein